MSESISELEAKVATQKPKVNAAKQKISSLKDTIIAELTAVWPATLDNSLDRVIETNAPLINKMPDKELQQLRMDIAQAKQAAINRVMSELSASPHWFSCRDDEYSRKVGLEYEGQLMPIVKSIEREFVPVFSKVGFRKRYEHFSGVTDLMPINWSDFKSDKLGKFAAELLSAIREYCSQDKNLKELEKKLESKRALSKWKTT